MSIASVTLDPGLEVLVFTKGQSIAVEQAEEGRMSNGKGALDRSPTDKRALLARLLEEKAERAAQAPQSFAQQRFWLLDQLHSGDATYNISRAVRLKGDLHLQALRDALNEIVARHKSLRTNFIVINGQPVQSVSPSLRIEPQLHDLRSLPAHQREAEAMRLVVEAASRGFNLERGPLLQVSLFHLEDRDYVLLLVMHHIVSDGWSLGVLFRELSTLYEAFAKSQPSPLPPLPIQYTDFARWQHEPEQEAKRQHQLNFWKSQLAGAPPLLELPADHPRPAIQSFTGDHETFRVDKDLTDALNDLSRRENVTLFMTLLAAFQTLLYRYTNQRDILVGSPIANRTRTETEGLIGFFVNTLVLRTDFNGHATFHELLRQVKEVSLEAFAHQDLPFERLVEELQPERSLAHMPVVQVLFALQNTPRSTLRLGDLELTEFPFPNRTSKLDLSLYVGETSDGLTLSFEYSTELFDGATIQRIVGHFQTLLRAIVANPAQRIDELPLLTGAEQHQMLSEWNNLSEVVAGEQLVHEVFEARVEEAPDKVALVFESERITYRKLNRRANQLANYLPARGGSSPGCFGILLDRSAEMIVAMLAVLKTGGTYVPLDPNYPESRLRFICRDAGLRLVLTSQRLSEKWQSIEAPVLCLDRFQAEIDKTSEANPVRSPSTDQLAYIIYTSGSTGEPKGVAVTHRTLVHLWAATSRLITFSPDDVWTTVHSIAFDFSVWEIWPSLMHGGRLVVVAREVGQSPSELYELIQREQVTVLNQTPAALRQLLEARRASPEILPDWPVRVLICGGDALDQDLALELAELPISVWNFYGPTENTVWTTANLVESNANDVEAPANSIGRPLPGIHVYLLNEAFQLVPVGVAAELFIGGDGLALGYPGHPDLTATSFVPNPFSANPGSRMYRTGDLARYRRNGKLEFLGRRDNQVKLRGFRIELEEIEATLVRHPDISEAVVIIKNDLNNDQKLLAYAVPADGRTLNPEKIFTFLRQSLPDYMIPASLSIIDALPLTTNQKVDRAALARLDPVPLQMDESFAAPRTPAEEIIANIWSTLLGSEQVGVNDNFFALGGHSLLAARVMARIRSTLNVEVQLRTLFQYPTIAELISHLDESRKVEAPPLVRVERGPVTPASFAQQRLWFLHQLDPGSSYNMSRALRLKGPLDLAALKRALNALVTRHETLRTNFQSHDGEPVQIVYAASDLKIESVDLSEFPAAQRESRARVLTAAAALKPFDLAQEQLLRATLFKLDPEDHVLLLVTHHIVSDGWSMTVMLRELGSLYEAQLRDSPSDLPDLPIQYADFALWQSDWFDSKALAEQVDYWKHKLAGAPALLDLPADRVRPAVQSSAGTYFSTLLPPALLNALNELSRREGATLFMTLLAAFQSLLFRITQREDILVGTPVANRHRIETEGLIGYFANTLVLRCDLSGNPTFSELLTRVRETCLEAYAHQDLPFEKLVEELRPERSLSHMPLVQVLLALQNVPQTGLTMSNLEVNEFSFDRQTSKLDLSLYARETPEGLALWFEYSTNLFDSATIERMAGHLLTLIEGIVAEPESRISDLPMLTATEQREMLARINVESESRPVLEPIHRAFEHQAQLHPTAVAVRCGEQSLTYDELNRKANRIAHFLTSRGLEPDSLVGVFLDRSVNMIVALLGIMKAGGAYVPLEPSYPGERLSYILKDANIKILLTERALRARVPRTVVETLVLDDEATLAQHSEANPVSQVSLNQLAYVIYTSGSTGRPKGVAVTHASVANLFNATAPVFDFRPDDVWTVSHSYAFDFSVWEIFGALVSGGRLLLVPRAVTQAPEEFLRLLHEEHVTVLGLTPSALRPLLTTHSEIDPALDLRVLVVGGEAFPGELVGPAMDWGVPVWNFFGPTETTVWVSVREVERTDAEHKFVPLGGPIADTQIYIVDPRGAPLPVGIPGELCVGGTALALGYLNRPDLTGDKFIPDPFSGEKGSRIYRTGDLARYLANGTIEYVGRVDHQIKWRGFRIEPGEIEAALSKHPAVRQNVVVRREDLPGRETLVAYFVAGEAPATVPELRAFLKQALPEYMIPTDFIPLDSLPVNANGKIDRRALPLPNQDRPSLEVEFIAPRNELERTLAEIWTTVLKRERVGVHDNFFELGGHSLMATQLLSRIRNRLNREIPLRRLFETPTVEGLAQAISSSEFANVPQRPAIRKRSRPEAPALNRRIMDLSEREIDSMLGNVIPGRETHQ